MEKIIESFKNLYKGEGVAAKHWALVSLFVLPALLSGVASLMDKDTPSQAMLIIGIAVLFFVTLSIVPMIWLLGYAICFAEERLMGKVGIPKVSLEVRGEGVEV